MSSFGAKRKARVIKVADDEENGGEANPAAGGGSDKEDTSKPLFGSKSGRKPFRQSGLRKSFNPGDDEELSLGDDAPKAGEDDDGPVVVRPSVSRSGSLKQKKRPPKSRLSFGGDPGDPGDAEAVEVVTPKKPLGQRVLENSAAKRGVGMRGLPVRSIQDEEERPKYSKEYLDELQQSTPNTPRDLSTLHIDDADEMDLDPSELDGAVVVDSSEIAPRISTPYILSEAEIRERKERRVRLAQEENFLSVQDDDNDDDTDEFGRKKKESTRLVAEDEDLGEGFETFVDDGGLSLGKRAEKERRKRERQKMAELITAAEGHSSDSSSDSDAERRIAYEAAQTRAGMDGLKKPRKDHARDLLQVPPKITPLPSLSECLGKLQLSLRGMEGQLQEKRARAEQLRSEREEIMKREGEVQALLDETGRKYQEAMGQKPDDVTVRAAGPAADLASERGLESLGTTPLRAAPQEEEDL